MNSTARHRRHVARARAQGRADGPATIAAMQKVGRAALVKGADLRAAAAPCQHPAECVVTSHNGVRQCVECGDLL